MKGLLTVLMKIGLCVIVALILISSCGSGGLLGTLVLLMLLSEVGPGHGRERERDTTGD